MYEDQYYIVDKVFSDDTLYLKATKTTAKRKYGYKKLEYGEAPLFFENAYKDRDIKLGKVRAIKSAHMNITHLIVDDDIKEKIDKFDISNFQFYPAVIIDDGGDYHENFWFFNIFGKLDVLDLEGSVIEDFDRESNDHDVERFKLKKDVLDTIDEEKRLIFMMPNLDRKITFVHQRIVNIFSELKIDTINFHRLSEWTMGDQYIV